MTGVAVTEFRLLGPVEVWAGGRRVDAGPPRQRTILAALLVDAGRAVTVDTLVDRVWGEAPPRGARQSLHAHLARVRAVLRQAAQAGGSPAQVVFASGCYRLHLDRSRLDVHRFLQLSAQARDPRRGDARRLLALREAVALWCGEPLAGIGGRWAEQCRRSWRQQYLDVTLAWAQAELDAGNPGPVIVALSDRTAEYPLVEPLAAALMRALRAAGRSGEALQHYAVARRHLTEELGTDPGAELRALHQRILRDTASLPVTVTTPPPAVPAQLPPDVPGFAGRDAQLFALGTMLAASIAQRAVPIAAASGPAGVGKTALAVHWAHTVSGRFPDGQLYVDLRGRSPGGQWLDPAEALSGFLDALGVAPQRVPTGLRARTALYRSLVTGRRILVVLDNARDGEHARPLLPGTPTALAVVTSRDRLTGLLATDGAQPVRLDVLPAPEARQLLARRLGARLVAAEPDCVEQIVSACAGLPLALVIVAARARQTGFPLAALAAELCDASQRLDALDAGEPANRIRAVFASSYTALTAPAARLFRLLGLHPGPDIGTAAAAALTGHQQSRAHLLLTELVQAGLLTEHLPRRYRFHDLLRTYAAELGTAQDRGAVRQQAQTRLFDRYTRRRTPPSGSPRGWSCH